MIYGCTSKTKKAIPPGTHIYYLRLTCKASLAAWLLRISPKSPSTGDLFVSPLATLAFKLCVVGDTGLKTGCVRRRHGAGWGGAGRISSEARISAFLYRYRTAFLVSRTHKPTTLRTSPVVSVLFYKCCSLAPGIQSACVCVVTFFTAVLSNCTHFSAR